MPTINTLLSSIYKGPPMTNVLSDDQKMDLQKEAAGFIKTTIQNISKVASKRSLSLMAITSSKDLKSGMRVVAEQGDKATPDLIESSKGLHVSTTG